ncbi:MAG: DUF4215 domain-containing protein, partial [Myxococcota bacterium]
MRKLFFVHALLAAAVGCGDDSGGGDAAGDVIAPIDTGMDAASDGATDGGTDGTVVRETGPDRGAGECGDGALNDDEGCDDGNL